MVLVKLMGRVPDRGEERITRATMKEFVDVAIALQSGWVPTYNDGEISWIQTARSQAQKEKAFVRFAAEGRIPESNEHFGIDIRPSKVSPDHSEAMKATLDIDSVLITTTKLALKQPLEWFFLKGSRATTRLKHDVHVPLKWKVGDENVSCISYFEWCSGAWRVAPARSEGQRALK